MDTNITELTSDIVSAYVAHNTVAAAALAELIAQTHQALDRLSRGEAGIDVVEAPRPSPAIPIRRSITPDFLISLEDGRKYRSLKRHLSSQYGMTPADYRAKWGLPADYPMVAPSYSKQRSDLAKARGLGQNWPRSRRK